MSTKAKTKKEALTGTPGVPTTTEFKQPAQQELEKLSRGLWQLAKTSLWQGQNFTKKQEAVFSGQIAEHFYNGKSQKQNFCALAERLIMTHCLNPNGKFNAAIKPLDWLNIQHPKGLSATAIDYQELCDTRKTNPGHCSDFTLLATGLYHFFKSPKSNTIQKYKALLQQCREQKLHAMFLTTVVNTLTAN